MRGALFSRSMRIAGLAVFFGVSATTFSQSAFAQGTTVIPPPPNPSHNPEFDPVDPHRAFDPKTGQNLVWDCNKKTWIDTKTGQGIGFSGRHDGNDDVIPPPPNPSHNPEFDPVDPNRAFDPKTGQNLVWDRDHHTWKDTKTGKGVGFSGRLVKEACPPPPAASGSVGMYLGGEIIKNWGRVRSTETLATTDVVTNQFSDDGDPIGAGVVLGCNFAPWNNSVVFGPFASFDWLNQTINHTFAGGTFLGTTTHWIVTAGAKAGVVTAPGLTIYGLAGASWLNHDLNINFATAASQNTTTPGFTAGIGGEWQLSALQQGLQVPVSVFFQYQHTWWSNANFNTPASSPAFNYAFRREDDTVKLGLNFYFGGSPATEPTRSPMLVKVLPTK